jgi:hypothetical protein
VREYQVINNPARPGSNHREVNYINNNNDDDDDGDDELKSTLRCKINMKIKQ